MNPATIIEQATADRVHIALSGSGSIKATGEQTAVDKWLPAIREHKPEIIRVLLEAELRELVQAYCEREQWPADEIREAVEIALADFESALTCFRDLVGRTSSL